MTETARVARPEELLTLLPYLLGYHPTESLVLVGLVDRRRLGPVERLDLLARGESYPIELLASLSGPLRGDGADAVLLVAFGGAPASRARSLGQVSGALRVDGVEVVDRLAVVERRWWSVDCRDPACCPPGGGPLPAPHEVPAVADFVWRGVAPFSDRAALAEQWSAAPAAAEAHAGATEELTRAEALAAWEVILSRPFGVSREAAVCGGVAPAGDSARRAAAAAADPTLRDEILARLCPGLLLAETADDGMHGAPGIEDVPAVLDAMAGLARSSPGTARYDVLAMAATVAWWHGHGTAARVCVEEVVRGAPGHSLGRLLNELMDAGVRPGGCR